MTSDVNVLPLDLRDLDAVLEIYPAAFVDEDLTPLVSALATDDDVHHFVARKFERVVAHAAFSKCGIAGDYRSFSLLGPLAVAPEFQRCGIGGQLINTGLNAAKENGVVAVCVLGDPNYYGRFGFKIESEIQTPYALPAEWASAWQSIWLSDERISKPSPLVTNAPWRNESLWR